MMDKSRQQFEEFIKFHMDDAEINNKFEKANNGLNYADQYVDLMWISWEASRESLEIELPEPNPEDSGSPNFYDGYNTAISDIHDELISNGVKIKDE
ncbi:hypothetical protein NBG74_00145 [Proteus mirabilis]|uniref:hypothetical protein n=2 Tax=Proteus mirabilis TaxID=584 RepID=UPI0016254723|nr:hypothetical protein [Proteus mirabilis]MBB6722227.1 hypothetical protein [Proteus mirabilis]MBS3840313.1 hypothetical protein [Proteus mirabilis]MCL8557667.1 hypothetical protein [Proteus mirabilis]MCT8197316.1 hypothetical protein [Proteus mirabilis]HCQ8187744.1 hypothetical protein [Proteus mirabilis]